MIYYLYSRNLENRIKITDHPLRCVSAGQELESVLIQLTVAGFRLHVDRWQPRLQEGVSASYMETGL